MNYIKLYFSIFNICKKFSLPNDILNIIFKFYINNSSQIIINSWYNYIMIHNINPSYIMSRLKLYISYDSLQQPFFYYDLYNKNVGITFNICSKYLSFNISDTLWWIDHIKYALNSLSFFYYDINNINFKYNYKAIFNFYNKLYY